VLGLLLAQVLGNALFEEVGYRGFLLRQFELRLGWVTGRRRRLAVAAALSLALFALMHVPNRLSAGFAGADLATSVLIALALGVLLTLLYLRTGNLLLVVGVHALINTPTLLVASPASHEIVEVLAVLLLVAWPRLTRTMSRRTAGAPAATVGGDLPPALRAP
jgi:membrane protease YdiL (CAAX protease family)